MWLIDKSSNAATKIFAIDAKTSHCRKASEVNEMKLFYISEGDKRSTLIS